MLWRLLPWKVEAEKSPLAGLRLELETAAALCYFISHDGQSKSGTPTQRFRGKKRFKRALLGHGVHTYPIVFDLNHTSCCLPRPKLVAPGFDANMDGSAGAHGIARVRYEVDDNLLNRNWLGTHPDGFGFGLDKNSGPFTYDAHQQTHQFIHERDYIHWQRLA
jgi:hypothetical protein